MHSLIAPPSSSILSSGMVSVTPKYRLAIFPCAVLFQSVRIYPSLDVKIGKRGGVAAISLENRSDCFFVEQNTASRPFFFLTVMNSRARHSPTAWVCVDNIYAFSDRISGRCLQTETFPARRDGESHSIPP